MQADFTQLVELRHEGLFARALIVDCARLESSGGTADWHGPGGETDLSLGHHTSEIDSNALLVGRSRD